MHEQAIHSSLVFASDIGQQQAVEQAPLRYSFAHAYTGDGNAWRSALLEKLQELLGCDPSRVPLDPRWSEPEARDCGTLRRVSYAVEPTVWVPAVLMLPKEERSPRGVVICLQGHASGMHISLGEPQNESDERSIAGGRDFAIQAVAQGYAALVIEQRCFGLRMEAAGVEDRSRRCHRVSLTSLLLGRTMLGERIWDVRCGIDLIRSIPELASLPIFALGNSGGGTSAYYAAAVDPRISGVVASCSICDYRNTLTTLHHCVCNYLPGALNWFELSDLAGLIAPRPLLVVAGRDDTIFPLQGTLETFRNISQIYTAVGVPKHCHLLIGEGGHRFFPDLVWDAINEGVLDR